MNLLVTSHIIMRKALQFVTVQSQVENSRSGQRTVKFISIFGHLTPGHVA